VSGGRARLLAAIEAAGPKVAAVLARIRQRSPHAAVYVVGYPDILPEDTDGCRLIMPIAGGAVAYLRQTETELNAMLVGELEAHGATYVETHTPTSPAAPSHPNFLGRAAMAKALEAAIG
jgi:hypothetical protein